MFVLDTNVISELMRDRPHLDVLAWLDNQLTSALFVTTITEAEIRTGIALLPEGKRRQGLTAAAERTFGALFSERVLSFDSEAARAYAEIASSRRMAGHPISQADCQIAAIVRSRGLSIATRDEADFEGCGIEVLNPWTVQ